MATHITRKESFLEDLEANGFEATNFGQTMVLYRRRHTESSVMHLTENVLRDGYRLDGYLISVVDGQKRQEKLTDGELDALVTGYWKGWV